MEKLRAYQLARTRDLDEARDAVTTTYLPNRLTQLGRQPMQMALNAFEDDDVTVGYLKYSTLTTLQMPPSEDYYHVNLTTGGCTDARREDRQTTQSVGGVSGVVLLPHLHSAVTWSGDAEQVILRFSRTRLERHLSRILGCEIDGPIHFDLGLDLTTVAGSSLLSTTVHFADELDRLKDTPELALLRHSWEELVMTQLLFAARHSFREKLAISIDHCVDKDLRHLLDYIEQRLQLDVTIEELATVAGKSIRSVYVMFREQLDVSPRVYIRRKRLQKIRSELQRPHSGTTVSSCAHQWGMTHLGRFSAAYKKSFGESPSETLLAARAVNR